MFEVDNAGNPDCAFLSFAKGLIWLIQGELEQGRSPLLTKLSGLSLTNEGCLLAEQDQFSDDPALFIQAMNLRENSYFLRRVQVVFRRLLVKSYFDRLAADLIALQQESDENVHAIISRNEVMTELLAAVYGVLKPDRELSINDFFRDELGQEKIVSFVSTLNAEGAYGSVETIAPTLLKEFILSMFTSMPEENASGSCRLFDSRSDGARLLGLKAKQAWGTFNDLTVLANFFDVNLVVVNDETSLTSSLGDHRAKIYLKHTATPGGCADHWTTILNAFPYAHCATLPYEVRRYEKRACSFGVSKVEIKELFCKYISKNFKWFCCWNSRDHLQLAEDILQKCEKPLETPASILTYLLANAPSRYNPQGSFAEVMNYLCYRQFGMSYAQKQHERVDYQQLVEAVRPTVEDLQSYRPLIPKLVQEPEFRPTLANYGY